MEVLRSSELDDVAAIVIKTGLPLATSSLVSRATEPEGPRVTEDREELVYVKHDGPRLRFGDLATMIGVCRWRHPRHCRERDWQDRERHSRPL